MRARAAVSIEALSGDPHPILHRLRSSRPVAWIEALDAWLVTRHDLCAEVMLDPDGFTVDDPRFSTQQVIGPSMLSLDGAEHRRHRDPFAGPFRAAMIRELEESTRHEASRLVSALIAEESGDLRSRVAGPLAVAVMARALDLDDVDVAEVLNWYRAIVDAVHVVTAGGPVPASGEDAFEALKEAVIRNQASSRLLAPVMDDGTLTLDEIVSDVAVLLFGGIVTSESAIAIAYRYVLDDPVWYARLRADRSLVRPFVEETMRLEPAAAAVDRFATRDVTLGGASVRAGDLVRVSLSAANRDPRVFDDPDRVVIERQNHSSSLSFARGPHACLGVHLARLETLAAVGALLDHPQPAGLGRLAPVSGLVFRAPDSVYATWREADGAIS